MATKISKKMVLQSINQTAQRSQCLFTDPVTEARQPGKPVATPQKMFSYVSSDPKEFAGLEIGKEYTITIQ